ncbi:MAG: O-antigen ligase family protein [Bacteroidia bacterium]
MRFPQFINSSGQSDVSALAPWLLGALGIVAVLLALLIGANGTILGVAALAAVVGLPFMMACLLSPRFGVFFVVTTSFFLMGIKRFNEELPLGLLIDFTISVMLLGILVRQIRERDWSFAKGPVGIMVLIWLFYNLMQAVNPNAISVMAWAYTVRGMAGIMIMFFITSYAFNSIKVIDNFFKLFFGLTVLAALYTLWQEFFGLADFEFAWILKEERRYHLLFQAGKFRKFSFLSDPVVLGIMLAYGAMMAFIISTGVKENWKRISLIGIGALFVLAMLYTGTRTAYVLLIIGFGFYAALSLKRIAIAAVIFTVVGGLAILRLPTVNVEHYRLKTAFSIFSGESDDKDKSFLVRLENQKRIQPLIQKNPIGMGLGRTGIWGKRFSPGDFLSKFPPDSGFVRIAVELGWLGLLIYFALLFVILRTGIINYSRCKDPKLRTYYQAALTTIFMLIIAEYPQEAINAVPTNLIFLVLAAIVVRIPALSKKEITNTSTPKEKSEPRYASV